MGYIIVLVTIWPKARIIFGTSMCEDSQQLESPSCLEGSISLIPLCFMRTLDDKILHDCQLEKM